MQESAKRDKTSRMNRIGAWIALVAIGFHALWPLLAQAGPRSDPGLAEVCSAAGAKHAPAQAPQSHVGGAHCLLCPLSGDRGAAIPRLVDAGWIVPAPAPVKPRFDVAAPAERDSAVRARSRAPPASS